MGWNGVDSVEAYAPQMGPSDPPGCLVRRFVEHTTASYSGRTARHLSCFTLTGITSGSETTLGKGYITHGRHL